MGRYRLLVYFFIVFIGINLSTRVALLLHSISHVDTSIWELMKLFTIGASYDVVACFYYSIPFVIYLFLIPQRVFSSGAHRAVTLVLFFGVIYSVVFNGVSEWFFWEEFGKRFNFIAVDYLVYTHEVIQNIRESYPMPLLIGAVFIVSFAIFLILYKKSHGLHKTFNSTSTYKQRLTPTAILLLVPIISFAALSKQDIANGISKNRYNQELSKNGFYSLFSAFRNNELDYNEFYISKSINKVLKSYRTMVKRANSTFESDDLNKTTRHIDNNGTPIKPNVMLVMIESMSASYMGVYGDGKNLTPNLDDLTHKSLFFSNFYATGTRTVRGMEAVTMSVPPTAGRSIVKRPDNYDMFGMGWIFDAKGYDNKFIYAGHGYFDNMNEYFGHNGFKIVDRNSFDEDEISFANVWGVCDEDLFDKSIKEADDSYEHNHSFFSFIMTTSNHRPYTYPKGKIDIPSHSGRDGGVKYTDYAIGQFLDKARMKPWFDNTIFIFVADHNGGSAGKTDLPLYRYKIPFMIYAPKIVQPQNITKLASQIDLAPTLFAIMHWDYNSKMYGHDILSEEFRPRALIGTYQKLGLYQDGKLSILLPDHTSKEYRVKKVSLRSNSYEEMTPDERDIYNAITYYQSASYYYKNRLDRRK